MIGDAFRNLLKQYARRRKTSDLFSVICESFHKTIRQNGSTSYAIFNSVHDYNLEILVSLVIFYSSDDAIYRYLFVFTF
jgi:hypothetical protein